MMQAGKVWADSWQRQQRAQGGRLTHALSLRSGARLDFQEFAAGDFCGLNFLAVPVLPVTSKLSG